MSISPAVSASSARRVAVFDLGGVLIDWNPRYLYRQVFDDPVQMEHFLAHVCTPEWNACQDAGRSWDEAVDELSARFPHEAARIALYRDRWEDTLGDAIAPTVAVLDELRAAGVALYALTNWSAQTFPVARRRFPFLAWFDGILVSGEERLAKPDPAIFRLLLSRFGIDPAGTAFIDDAPRNVAAASAAGLRGVQFTDAQRLREDLRALGYPLAATPPAARA